MKTLRLIILMALTLSSAYTIEAQSKNELEATLKKCTIDKDSISEANKRLTTICDSLKKVATAYDTMYMVIKSKVLLKDFNPAQMNYLVDSLRQTGKDYAFGTLVTLNDSVSLLKMDNKRLNETIKKMNSNINERSVVIYDLRQLKLLLDENIITQLEFNEKKANLIEKL